MPKYIIERAIPDIGAADAATLSEAAAKSNAVLAEMQAEQKEIHWDHSYVAGDKTVCVYRSASEDLIHEHAQRSGFPATSITEVKNQIDPSTAKA